MKKILMMTVIGMVFSTTAIAKTVYYPEEACAEIVSQNYSTGGGESVIQYLEILCVDLEGNYTGFLDTWGSGAGLLGLGRMTTPDVFEYVPYDGQTMRVE